VHQAGRKDLRRRISPASVEASREFKNRRQLGRSILDLIHN
jgi:hypothetical protein